MATGDPCSCGFGMLGACPRCNPWKNVPTLVQPIGSTFEMGYNAGFKAGRDAALAEIAALATVTTERDGV